MDLARLVAVGVDAPGLGHAPDLDEREAETVLEGGMKLRVHPRPEPEAHPVRPLLRNLGLVHEQRRDDAEVVRHRVARVSTKVPPPSAGMEAVGGR